MQGSGLNIVVFVLSWACLGIGVAFSVIGGFGMLRLPDFYTRMHAAGMIDTMGAGMILLGLMLQAGPTMVTVKLVLIGIFIFFTSPVSTHAVAKAALSSGLEPYTTGKKKEGGEPSRP